MTSVSETLRKIEEKFPQIQNSLVFSPSPTMTEIIKMSHFNLVFHQCPSTVMNQFQPYCVEID